jgi:alpha-glucosidase
MMTRATSEGLTRLLPHRFLLFSRSSYIGASRYGGVWTGDNTSKWEHLMLNIRHAASLNLCGFLYSGADTGGFMGNCTRELLLRWLAFSVFTPLMRNHTGKFTRNQEAYQFGDTADFRSILCLRYRLLPYLYSEYMKAALGSDMFIKPLSFLYDDPVTYPIEDQLVVGDSIMIAPVVREGATQRQVYLPEDMIQVRWDGREFATAPMVKGWHTVAVALWEVVFYIRKGKLLPIGKAIANTAEYDPEHLELLGDGESYALYTDDGLTRDCSLENVRILRK